MTLLSGINTLFKEESFVATSKKAKLDKQPVLSGDFQFEPITNEGGQS